MKIFTVSFKSLSFSALLLFFVCTLCSFSSVSADVRDDEPPVEKTQESRRQQRLSKRYNRLYQRFDQTTNTKQRHRLQKKIRAVERQQEGGGSPALGIVGMTLAILAFVLLMLSFFFSINLGNTGNGVFGLGALIVGITALVLSIIYGAKNSKDPERFPSKGFSIAGIVVSSVVLGILLAFFIIVLALIASI